MKFEKERGLEALTETLVWPEVGERWEWWGGGRLPSEEDSRSPVLDGEELWTGAGPGQPD